MTDGATTGGAAHDRIWARAARVATLARRLTGDRGLAGFTVEELCEEAGISRRTFFNYFSSKEEAVLGLPTRLDDGQVDARFLEGPARGSGSWAALVDDLATLTVARWDLLALSSESVADLIAALEREPRLLPRLHELSQQRERADIDLVVRREGLSADDPLAASAVLVVGALARASAEEFLREGNDADYPTILRRRLDATRELFTIRNPTQDRHTP